jgi:adenylosuccinate lyase
MNASRYTTNDMDNIWDDGQRYSLMLQVWAMVALCQSKHYAGISDLSFVTTAEALLEYNDEWFDLGLDALVRAVRTHEREVGHEVEALRQLAQGAVHRLVEKDGGSMPHDLVHLDMTSSDVVDLVDSVRIAQTVTEIRHLLRRVVRMMARQVAATKDYPCRGYTHMQVAEPITQGFRLMGHMVEFQGIFLDLEKFKVQAKSVRGAVGTSHVQRRFIRREVDLSSTLFERDVLASVCDHMRIPPTVMELAKHATQTAPRHNEYALLALIDRVAAAIHRLAITARFLYSEGEWWDESGVVGSSAMPHKHNPATWEQLSSLSQLVHSLCTGAWGITADQIDMRTLDDSAQRRVVWQQVSSITAYMLDSLNNAVTALKMKYDSDVFNDSRVWSSTILSYALRTRHSDRTTLHHTIGELVKNYPIMQSLRHVIASRWPDSLNVNGAFNERHVIEPCVLACIRAIEEVNANV